MQSFLLSTGSVALAEIGDKTQLLSLVLAARYRRPWPILVAILLATLANHSLAAGVGVWISRVLGDQALHWLVGGSLIAMAAWILVPDRLDATAAVRTRASIFATAFLAFFIAEMGDKTQIATVALAARFDAFATVVVGTTLGMMIANAPVVWCGEGIARRLPMRAVRAVAALLFAALGVATLWSGG